MGKMGGKTVLKWMDIYIKLLCFYLKNNIWVYGL